MPYKIVDHEDIRPVKAQRTGVYVGPDGDYRFYKAGDQVAPTYRYSHERGAPLTAELQKQRDQQVVTYREQRQARLDEARALSAVKA